MSKSKVGILSVRCLLLVFILVQGCARNDGKKTFEYLTAERGIVKDFTIEFKQCSNPKPPTAPDLSKRISIRERSSEIKEYHAALNVYLNTVIQNSQHAERILNDTETKISGLDSAGVDEDAIDLTKSYESSLGDLVQIRVEVEALTQLEQVKLNNNKQSRLISTMIPGIIESVAFDNPTFAFKSFVKGVSSDLKQDIERNQEIQSHLMHLQEAATTFKHDIGDAITKRSELVTLYGAKYPKYLWNELLPRAMQTNSNKNNQ